MAFGYKNGGAALMSALHRVLGEALVSQILVYIDDLLIPGRDWDDHLDCLDEVLAKLEKANMTVNLNKCKFVSGSTPFLGFIISPDGIAKDSSYTQIIRDLSVPTNLKGLQRILGFFNWCSRYVWNYAEKAKPLYALLENKKKWTWREEHTQCFELLKSDLCRNILLVHPDLQKDFHLLVDASTISTAAILYQLDERGENIIGFSGKVLKPCETRYTVTELELLSYENGGRC